MRHMIFYRLASYLSFLSWLLSLESWKFPGTGCSISILLTPRLWISPKTVRSVNNNDNTIMNIFNWASDVPPDIMQTKDAAAAGVRNIAIYFSKQASMNIPASMSASQTDNRYGIDSIIFHLILAWGHVCKPFAPLWQQKCFCLYYFYMRAAELNFIYEYYSFLKIELLYHCRQ